MEIFNTNRKRIKGMNSKLLKNNDNVSKGFGNSSNYSENIFNHIQRLTKNKNKPKSYSWYRDNVRMLYNKSSFYKTLSSLEDTISPSGGTLYLFEYDATWGHKLKYFDEFPLVYVLEGGTKFFGANLHYLNLRQRLNIILQLQNGNVKFPKQCFHNYVNQGLRTPLFKINNDDWITSIFLPIESFVTKKNGMYQKVGKSFVWGETNQ